MFADPTSLTIDSVATDFPRIEEGGGKAIYREVTKEFTFTMSRVGTSRTRHLIRLDQKKIAANPVDSENAEVKASVYTIVDIPNWGYDAADMTVLFDALSGFLTAANMVKVIAGEV